ncbi:MAG: hypothetical protein KKD63_13270 [Proteobacteria bacterium]|nr:hypothetical protein [Desulfobulbaceae bacterium]MBU4153838.1 hypothetical protein [Pseudomonadota bacterium]MDP2106397.1 hypothetical protein [Desulfobulbaceae bacterium]
MATISNVCKILFTLLIVSWLTGCSNMNLGPTNQSDGTSTSNTYYPTKFRDLEVPNELTLDSSKTLYVNTSSFAGGIVYMTGRLEVRSLTDFFTRTMQQNGWKLTGEAHYKNVLLAFSKPNKNCMITLYEGELGTSTKVYAYMTEDLTSGGSNDGSL